MQCGWTQTVKGEKPPTLYRVGEMNYLICFSLQLVDINHIPFNYHLGAAAQPLRDQAHCMGTA